MIEGYRRIGDIAGLYDEWTLLFTKAKDTLKMKPELRDSRYYSPDQQRQIIEKANEMYGWKLPLEKLYENETEKP